MNNKKIRAIAYYLPQFHPIPENDEWWGKGFTEWTNVTKAKPLFKGHKQPKLPADLGFYDLRVPEVREQQAQLAKDAGIEGFCYWHYWFGNGKRLLERPIQEVLDSGKPDFPFCLAWANETWSGIWHGAKDKILIKQEYPGNEDYEAHFYAILPAFIDKRYIRIDDKPIFVVYRPLSLPDIKQFSKVFNELAIKNGLKGIHLIAVNVGLSWKPNEHGFDAVTFSLHGGIVQFSKNWFDFSKKVISYYPKIFTVYKLFARKPLLTFKYKRAMKYFVVNKQFDYPYYPTAITGWDNTPRSTKNGMIYTGYNPEVFREHLKEVIQISQKNENNMFFIKSWNEWAEGNYLEPDREFGNAFLEVLKEELSY